MKLIIKSDTTTVHNILEDIFREKGCQVSDGIFNEERVLFVDINDDDFVNIFSADCIVDFMLS